MRVCPNCKRENPDDIDFCQECNTYLRWDPTVFTPAVPSGTQETPPAPTGTPPVAATDRPPGQVAQRLPVIKEGQTLPTPAADAPPPVHTTPLAAVHDLVQITLRLPGQEEGAGSAFVATDVPPGGSTVVHALVRNQSGIVDNYDLSIDGMPAEWWTITPSTVYLVPFGAPGGQYEQEVEIRLHPPRSPEAEARPWLLRVVAVSKAHEREAGSASITSTITPYEEYETELRPEYVRGRWRGTFAIAVRNRANAPMEFAFAAVDSSNACRFDFGEPVVTAAPGKRAGTVFRARPRKQLWTGKAVDRRFEVTTTVPGSQAAVVSRPGVFHQRPWIPKWVPLAIPIAAAAVAAVILLLPHNTTVPNLKGLKLFAAQKVLEKNGLVLGPPTQGHTAPKPKLVGKIEDQSKPPGTKVKKGTAISVQVYTGTGTVPVPSVTGMTLNQASAALAKVKLQIGREIPEPADPDKGKVVSQRPPPGGTPVAEGSTVDLYFPAVKEESTPTNTGATTTGAGSGTTGGGTQTTSTQGQKGSVPVAAVAGLLGTAASARLVAQGFDTQTVDTISAKKVGTVVGQSPASGTPLTPGAPIQLFVSVGYPEIAFDNGADIEEMNGATGKPVKKLAASSDVEDEPSWQPGGTFLAYRRGPDDKSGAIWILDTNDPVSSARQFSAGPNDRRPAFSPNGKVVAFIRVSGSKGALCFAPVKSPTKVSCATSVTANVDRPAWSPDGKAILTVSQDAADPTKVQLFLFTTTKPFSPNVSNWSAQGPAGPATGAAIYSAFSPDGKQVAIAANWNAKDPSLVSLFLAPWTAAGLGSPKEVTPAIRACEVAWRSDGQELAVTQSPGCQSKTGDIVRLDPAKPSNQTPLGVGIGADPAWQPLTLGTR